ncbi:MAG: DNA replication/repair protein RecF [Desulfuromonadaceae bacterium]|nr:DNA replication/repair protein RecF [Desulfuromonadaceae bacterium]MDD2850202.1 DNA replication/repair protein RecF [Desulfuromonadaceae bacterium]MDD4131587.1 DNA replication/repair protein RecF [Desulfuromonadaceae bacterium]
MRLCSVAVADFRNIRTVHIEPGERFNLLYGLNGQGKTNLLEAIYLLGNPRSFRTFRLPELVRHGERQARIYGSVESGGIENNLQLVIEAAGRKVQIDGKAVHKASELHGKLNAVIFSPDDTGMVRMGPESRRRYLDRAVYMGDIGYLHCWHSYHRILKQRNHLLKSSDRTGLDIWTEKLAETGAEVIERRLKFVAVLDTTLQKYYATIAGGSETSRLGYQPEGVISTEQGPIREELLELFKRHQRSDERYGTTTAGPHRDDLTFMLDERPLKAFGSQGQQKSFVLALKMAEMDNLHDTFGESPLLLLDDMSSELDACRNHNLMEFLTTREIQVFITTTERSPSLLEAAPHCAVFHVEDGNLTFEGN